MGLVVGLPDHRKTARACVEDGLGLVNVSSRDPGLILLIGQPPASVGRTVLPGRRSERR